MNASVSLASSLDDAFAAAPLLVLAVSVLAALGASAFARRKAEAAFAACVVGLALALAASIALSLPMMPRRIAGLLSMDGVSFIGAAIVLASSLAVALASGPYLAGREDERGEFYVLLLLAALGASVLVASSSLASLALGLELLSVSLYSLVAYRRESTEGAKAAFTYLILASAASAFLLFGMALSYFRTGSLDLSSVAEGPRGPMMAAALAMMGAGFAFKLAVAPFHMWAPEVYEGAGAPATALIATVSKAAMAIPLIRVLSPLVQANGAAAWIVAALSAASMAAGNLLALREDRIKRMLAGSSIAQLGYVLAALVAGSDGIAAALFYLAAYSLSTLGAFACIVALSARGIAPGDRYRGDARREDFRGLASRRPFVAAAMTASLLSLAGLPLTAGFIGKFLIFSALARGSAATGFLAVMLALNGALSIYYYLRLTSLMYRRPEAASARLGAAPARPARAFLAIAALALLSLAILALGIGPEPAIGLVSSLVGR